MVEEIVDLVSEDITPFLIHFGEIKITPEILDVNDGSCIQIRRVPGPRLGTLLLDDSDLNKLKSIYAKLGYKVGYISKYCVEHGHLHTENVVVENDEPHIIDWGQGTYFGITYSNIEQRYRFWMEQNSEFLLRTTKERLITANREIYYPNLERIYCEKFRSGLLSPLKPSSREIRDRAALIGCY
ncbi:hypothetical protein HYU23_04055 [Candidatus Woesearchaeota archaeon]|nr:hypothetical protein [Candidatus Woesearchaeota archaeon]